MIDILALLQCLSANLDKTTIKQFSRIILAMLTITGRVTMLGLSRWTEEGGSYRTIQRFFYKPISWLPLFWHFFHQHLFDVQATYILVGDESVVTKAGHKTHGLDYFFSSIYSRPVLGLAFFALSLVNVQQRTSHPMMVEQVIYTAEEKKANKEKKQAQKQRPKRPRGRPKGSLNRNKAEVALSPELKRIQTMLHQLLPLLKGVLSLQHLVMDGKFGHHHAAKMTQQVGLHLVSKMRCDANLYLPNQTSRSGRGAPKKYGDKIDFDNLPATCLQSSTVEKRVKTSIYQATLLHTLFAQPLNVVIIHKTNWATNKQAHVILFSTDLGLSAEQLIDFYCLRFQIEFNFRDAKQYWGLEDFMNTTPTAVTNAANLSLFMVSVSQRLLVDFRRENPNGNVLDLKSYYRGHKYVTETLKWLPEKPEPILIQSIFSHVLRLGWIHQSAHDP